MAMTIGALANAAGVNIQTIRYYERRGILAEPPRTDAGYRLYPSAVAERVRFIKRAQQLGFTLVEIEGLLELRAADPESCGAAAESARAKLENVGAKLRELDRLRRVLERFVRACDEREPSAECPILESLSDDEDHT